MPENQRWLELLSSSGHEIGNHSFHHEPWLHLYSEQQIEDEIGRAEECILAATGQLTRGFRGPGFSVSPTVIRVLERMGYVYDASTFPTFLGPLARTYYFMKADLEAAERRKRKQLFGKFSDGFGTLRPYHPLGSETKLVEIPVTTMPVFKIPIHLSYVMYLGQFSPRLARYYFRMSLRLCRWARINPSLLMHPLDFLGCDDDPDLGFFPAMGMKAAKKLELLGKILGDLSAQYEIVNMLEHARRAVARVPTSKAELSNTVRT